jgi:serine/threonine protein kinase
MPSLPHLSRSSIGRKSQSGIGRLTGRFSRLVGGASRMQATAKFLRRQLWAWPLIAAVLFGGGGLWVHHRVEDALRQQRINQMTTILNADVEALNIWSANQRATVQVIARDERLLPYVRELLAVEGEGMQLARSLENAPAQAALRDRLASRLKTLGYSGYFIVSPAGIVLASDQDAPIGQPLGGYRAELFSRVMNGPPTVSHPYRSTLLLRDESGELRANLPTMLAAATVRDESDQPVAALGLRIRPDDEFTRILQVAQSGDSGETYVFDKSGLLLSQSRFDEQLKQVGLVVDQPSEQSILTVELRDPGVDMTTGERPALRRTEQPLTRMAQAAVAGEDGVDVDGYRDYRGVPVVGAWRWLPEYDFGVATEIDVSEAFRPVYLLRGAFWTLMGLLALCAVAIFVAMLYMTRQQQALQRATLAARQLGQYALEEKLGAGGMGTVYRARHAMLRRPTAVKLLDVDKMSDAAIARFEREVQLTSALTHPNTVAIFDYGRTPEGIFYYAMEHLEGLNLDDLVAKFGPLSEARAVSILKQVCGSLAEAHAKGLVHRDIKPANIFLTCRGGLYDFVKVLDFGLVKSVEGSEQANLTNPNAVTGTPLYLPPEAVNHPEAVDARSDVYAIGAVGYYLLTGTPVFTGVSIIEICMKHVEAAPEPPSQRRGHPVTLALEGLLLRCLAKSPAERPADASAMLRELDACRVPGHWTADDAQAWWAAHGRISPEALLSVGTRLPETPQPAAFNATLISDASAVRPESSMR